MCSKASLLLRIVIHSTKDIALKTIYTINIGVTASGVLSVSLVPSPPHRVWYRGDIQWIQGRFLNVVGFRQALLMESVCDSHFSPAQHSSLHLSDSRLIQDFAINFQSLFCGVTECYNWERCPRWVQFRESLGERPLHWCEWESVHVEWLCSLFLLFFQEECFTFSHTIV